MTYVHLQNLRTFLVAFAMIFKKNDDLVLPRALADNFHQQQICVSSSEQI